MILFMRNSELTKFWIKIAAIILIFISLAGIFNKITDASYEKRNFGAYKDKLQSLANLEGHKTVFVGGSSVLFGVNAEYYEKLSGETTINMGLHAFKLYDIYFSTIKPYLHEGDTVVLAFEYSPYVDDWDGYDTAGLLTAHMSGSYYKCMDNKYRGIYTYQQLLMSYEKIKNYVYTNLIEKRLKGEEKRYLRSNIDSRWGDIKKGVAVASENPTPYKISKTVNPSSMNEILKNIKEYESLGVKVYIVFPPIYTESASAYEDGEQIYNEIKSYFGDRVLGKPSDCIYKDNQKFLDTAYHLTYDECLRHTEYYYSLLKDNMNQ